MSRVENHDVVCSGIRPSQQACHGVKITNADTVKCSGEQFFLGATMENVANLIVCSSHCSYDLANAWQGCTAMGIFQSPPVGSKDQ